MLFITEANRDFQRRFTRHLHRSSIPPSLARGSVSARFQGTAVPRGTGRTPHPPPQTCAGMWNVFQNKLNTETQSVAGTPQSLSPGAPGVHLRLPWLRRVETEGPSGPGSRRTAALRTAPPSPWVGRVRTGGPPHGPGPPGHGLCTPPEATRAAVSHVRLSRALLANKAQKVAR